MGPADFSVLLVGEQGALRARGKDGSARVPAGRYRLLRCSYRVADPSGRDWELFAQGSNGPAVEVPAGGEVKLPFGPPLAARLEARTDRGRLALNLTLTGSGGEVYGDVHFAGSRGRPPAPKARITDAAGKELALVDFRYGGGFTSPLALRVPPEVTGKVKVVAVLKGWTLPSRAEPIEVELGAGPPARAPEKTP
jgi:hypothetical protein